MTQYVFRRLLIQIPVLFGVTLLLFTLTINMPGDAVAAMISPDMPVSHQALEQLRSQLGLDQPWPIRYVRWLGNLLHGHLGFSYISFKPVGKIILSRIPATLELMGVSILFSVLIGTILGLVSALKRYSALDLGLTVFGFAGLSVPVFFLGLLLIYAFGLRLRWFPVSGMATPGQPFSIGDNLRHFLLPGLALCVQRIALYMRYARSSLLEVLGSDYLVVARAKGVPEHLVILKHGLRNALIPLITIVGMDIPWLFAGAVIIESVFTWPGIGLLYVKAVSQRDDPMIMGLTLMSAIVVSLSNLITDLSYSFVDPRIRYE